MKALFKFAKKIPDGAMVIDTTSNSGDFSGLSPFVLRVLERTTGKNVIFENLWQYSKVYKIHLDTDNNLKPDWFIWRKQGWDNPRAVRYPMGKGAVPDYAYWQDGLRGEWLKLNYIESRKQIYAPEYAKWVEMTDSYKRLKSLYESNQDIILLDYDAYDHQALGMTLKEVINNPDKKCGHAFILMMMLTGKLEDCLISPTE